VVDVARDGDGRQPMQMANPEVIWESDDARSYEEGCLSLPEHFAEVMRPEAVKVRYLDRENEIRTIDADDILATCIQHEIDHLDGVLFVDHISSLKRNMIIKKLQKFKKLQAEEATA
jgi:peptide deformylase